MPDNKSVISEGKTTNEAIQNGLKMLNVSKEMVNIKILENGEKKSFFSILAPRVVKVELILKEEINKINEIKREKNILNNIEKKIISDENLIKAESNVKSFLDQFINQLGVNIEYNIIKESGFGLKIEINGNESGFLIGYRGETLYSLQSLLSSIASKKIEDRIRVLLDIEGYKSKREKILKNLALKIEKTVEKTGKSIKLEPMKAYERKIIHATLQNSNKVKTESVGEEPRRRVIISLK